MSSRRRQPSRRPFCVLGQLCRRRLRAATLQIYGPTNETKPESLLGKEEEGEEAKTTDVCILSVLVDLIDFGNSL